MKAEFTQRMANKASYLGLCQLWQLFGVVTLAILLLCSPLLGLGTEGNITGTVTAQDGTSLPNAKVTITNEGTNISRSVISNTKGDYVAADLNPGTYTVKVEATGFGETK